MKRKTATIAITASCLIIGMLSCLGYGPWATITIIGMQFLDFFDFISNSVLMPIVALLTCILIGHVVGAKVIADEVKEGAGRSTARSCTALWCAGGSGDAGSDPRFGIGNKGIPPFTI